MGILLRAEMLKKNAGDPGGWMQRDSYRIDAVDAAVWKLQVGQISPVIDADDAFYIVKLEAKKVGRIRPFDDPAVVAHNLQRSGKSSTIHRQNLSQPPLGNFSDNRQRLQNGELRGS